MQWSQEPAAQLAAAEDEAQIEELLDALEETGRIADLDEEQARQILGVPARRGGHGLRSSSASPTSAGYRCWMNLDASCYSCARNAEIDQLPPRERVAVDDLWRVAHAFDSALPGWLVLLPRRHVTSIAALTDMEASSLGSWQVQLSRALHKVTGCEKTYIAQFGEAEGFAHVHFHVVPRAVGLADELRGPKIFLRMLGPDDRPHVSERQMNEIATELAKELRP